MFSFIRAVSLAAFCGVAAAGSASAVPLQVTGEDLLFGSDVNLGGTNLSNVGFSFTTTIESTGDGDPADVFGSYITGPVTFALATGGSITALAGELLISLIDNTAFDGGIFVSLLDVDGLSGGSATLLDVPPLFDVNAPTPAVLSNRSSGGSGGSGGTIDFGVDGLLTYSGGAFRFGDDPTITFASAVPVRVPAPASAPLFLAGLAGLAFFSRRRRSVPRS